MSLRYVIDGYNIINHRLFPRANRKVRGSPFSLVELVRTNNLCGSLKNKITIVFDGYPPGSCLRQDDDRVSIIFSQDSSADEIIKRLIEKAGDKKNTVVISDDKEITLFVKLCGVRTMGAEEFIGRRNVSGSNGIPAGGRARLKEDSKQDLNFSQAAKINEELKKIWLE